MVIGYHLIWTVYGNWLPNDPRGSMSRTIRQPHIASLGPTHYGRKHEQPTARELRAFLHHADQHLEHARIELDGEARSLVARSIGDVIHV
jgi:hypothetical protein